MYKNDPTLKSENEQINITPDQIQETIKCKDDIYHFAKYVKILTENGYESFEPRDYQKKVIDDIVKPNPEKPNNIIMMHRQGGKTTITVLYALYYATFNPDKNVAILANKESQALEIMARVREAYKQLPYWLQTGLKSDRDSWSKRHMHLANGTKIFASSASSSALRGRTIDLMIIDEMAHIPEPTATDFMMCVFPTMCARKCAKMILISTPNGMNHFYQIWQKSIQGLSSFVPTKVNIFDDKRVTPEDIEQMKINFGNGFFEQEWNSNFSGSNKPHESKKDKIIAKITELLHQLAELEE